MSKTTTTILSISAGALMLAGAFAVLPSVTGSAHLSDDVKTTIESGDYEAFQSVASDKLLERVESEEDFAELQERYSERQATKAEIVEAVENDDFDAFKAIIEEKQAQREADGKEVRELDEEKLREKFDEMVAEYEETGEVELGNKKRRIGRRINRRLSRD